MKKVFYSFLAAAMFAGVVSCGNKEEAAPAEEAAVEETVEVPAEAPVTEEVVAVDSAAVVAPVEAPAAK
jgi:predicted small lipoprotein YifL